MKFGRNRETLPTRQTLLEAIVVELPEHPTPTNVVCFSCKAPIDEWHPFDPAVCRDEAAALSAWEEPR